MHTDPLWIKLLLAIHIAAGSLAFLFAPVALATAKGGPAHRRWGMVYLWSMGVVAATALPMALFRPVLFLALVAIFSFYLAFSGFRVLGLKALARGGSARPLDWTAALVTIACCLALAALGLFRPAAVQHMGPEAVVFGLLGCNFAVRDLLLFVRKTDDKMFWWYTHLGRFLGSYIAAWTAFSAVTLSHLFAHATLLVWLWPTALGAPAITVITIYYKRKFAGRPSTSPLAPA